MDELRLVKIKVDDIQSADVNNDLIYIRWDNESKLKKCENDTFIMIKNISRCTFYKLQIEMEDTL